MNCPKCHHTDTKVLESRDASDASAIRRRRQCLSCSNRFTTYERCERPHLAIVKKDGSRELFDRSKLFRAIDISVGKFFSSALEIESIVAHVEDALYDIGENEIASKRIGELILRELSDRNEVAYVRFASVYHEFRTLDEFEKILAEQRQQKSQDKS